MPDYAEILTFLAQNPPQRESERNLHASLLELLAKCLRAPVEPQATRHDMTMADASTTKPVFSESLRSVN